MFNVHQRDHDVNYLTPPNHNFLITQSQVKTNMRFSRAKSAMFCLPLAILLALFSQDHVVDAQNLRSYPQGADYSSSPASDSSNSSVLKKFLEWPFSHNPDDVDSVSAYPLWSTRSALYNFDEKRPVFSFSLTGGAAERYRKRQANRVLVSEEDESHASDGHGDDHGDGHDAHSDTHEMVVHVTYEDICE